MRIYLKESQKLPVLDDEGNPTRAMRKFNKGFHRVAGAGVVSMVTAELAQEWLGNGLAFHATDDNKIIEAEQPAPDPVVLEEENTPVIHDDDKEEDNG